MKLDLKPDKVKIIQTTLITLWITLYLGIYYIFLIIPFYFIHSIDHDFKNKKVKKFFKKKKTIKVNNFLGYSSFSVILILYLFLILQFLNPVNAVKQSYRITLDKEGVSELDVRGVQELSKKIKENGVHPKNIRNYLKGMIEYKSDYEMYGIVSYWATPYETINRKEGDCEDYSILTKAITNYLDKDEEYKEKFKLEEVITVIIHEPYHSYTETNGKESGKQNTVRLGFFMFIFDEVWSLPLIRKVIFIIGIPLIVLRKWLKK